MARELLYFGASMNPLLRPGDTLRVIPYDEREIRTGDVVVFPDPRDGRTVVHRVVAVHTRGVTTKGDNNFAMDDWVLKPGDILGQVVAIRRKSRILPVPQEAPAALYLLRARQWFNCMVCRLLHPIYHRLAQSGLFKDWLPIWLKLRLLYFSRPDGPEWQLWLGRLLIGRKPPNQPHWYIRRPFRLFVDDASLPCQPANSSGNNPAEP